MKKIVSALFLAVTAHLSTTAQIIYHDISPDTTVGSTKLSWYVPDLPTAASFTIFHQPSLAAPYIYMAVHGPFGLGEVVFDAPGGLPAKLDAGRDINAGSEWAVATDHALYKDGTGNWRTDAADKYLGIRFRKGMSGTGPWHYGWIRLSVDPVARSFTVQDWAYQDVAGTGIKSGEKPATGIEPLSTTTMPQPYAGAGNIQFSGLQPGTGYTVRISSMNGQLLQQAQIRAEDPVLITDHLAPGIYALQLLAAGQVYGFKIMLP